MSKNPIVCLSVSAFTLCGCAVGRPDLIDDRQLPIDSLVAAIHCEFEDAVRHQIYDLKRKWIKTWQGAYIITIKGNEASTLKATAGLPFNIGGGSTTAIGFGGGVTSTANRTAILKFNLDFKDVKPGSACEYGASNATHPFLTGRIGFEEWMDRAIAGAISDPEIARNNSVTSIGHTFQFIVDTNASLSPVFTLLPAPVATISPTGTIDRTEDNSVDVTLAKPTPGTASVSTTTNVYSPSQKKQIADLEAEKKKIDDEIDQLEKEVASNKNKTLLEKQARLVSLKSNLNLNQLFDIKPESQSPDQKKVMELQKQETTELQSFLTKNSSDLFILNQKISKLQTDRTSASDTGSKLIQTLNHPASSQTIQRQVVTPGIGLTADQNPNIISTQTQQILERTLGNIRQITP